MTIFASKKVDTGVYIYARSIQEIVEELGVEGKECYLYTTFTGEVVAAQVARDATPADEEHFIGRYSPRWS